MAKTFNVNGACIPGRHYMVNLKPRLEEIKAMVDAGAYFTINKARQYGKTTTLRALADFLEKDYEIACLDFQRISSLSFEKEQHFVEAFAEELLDCVKGFPEGVEQRLSAFADGTARINSLQALFKAIRLWCGQSTKPIVLMIDEVDSASNNQVFLDFLAQLRNSYLEREARGTVTFQSVILAGLYDIKSLKAKIRPEDARKTNSPWNIAADFLVDMSFSANEIASMLDMYEEDWHTGMDVRAISQMLYEYTSGYPYLVSRLCQLIDERVAGGWVCPDKKAAWSKQGVLEAVRTILKEPNTLFDDMLKHLYEYPKLSMMLKNILFQGRRYTFETDAPVIQLGVMFGFLKEQEQADKVSDIRGEVKEIGFGNQIRSYVMQPYTMVKDHRTNVENSNVTAVLDGGIDLFMNAYLKQSVNI